MHHLRRLHGEEAQGILQDPEQINFPVVASMGYQSLPFLGVHLVTQATNNTSCKCIASYYALPPRTLSFPYQGL